MAKVPVLLALFALLGRAQFPPAPIVAVDFYGSAPVDFARLRAAFPHKVGDTLKPAVVALADTPPEFHKLVGGNRFSAATILIPDLHGFVLYIGIEPAAAPALAWKPEPAGADKLPPEILALYEHAMERLGNGGINAGDEITQCYSLSKDPVMRADELKLIDYARAHAATVYSVLASSASFRDRMAAAWIAGDAPRDKAQIAALLGAVTDPHPGVRNNSIRVLAVLAHHDPKIARQIPPDPFIPLLHSLDWTDRSKALYLLESVTKAGPLPGRGLRRVEQPDGLPTGLPASLWYADRGLTLTARRETLRYA